jgi:hypothetical protein
MGEIRNTMKGKYLSLGKYNRPIGKAINGNDTVNPTAIRRLQKRYEGYSPDNLIEYCEKNNIDFS